jgi:DNA-binding transcriptional MerR regulator
VSDDALTIEELAQRAGTRASTVRLYQTRGLLPPPTVRGRVGYYSTAHLARLRVIHRLQGRGFSLAAIQDLLDNWARGVSLADALDVEPELGGFGEPVELAQADFAALFPDGHVDPAVLQRATSLGLVAVDAERGVVRVPSRAFLEIGRELAGLQVPPARAIEEFERLATSAREIAERFVTLFDEYVDAPTEPLDAVTDRLRNLAAVAVQELVSQALTAAVAARSRAT